MNEKVATNGWSKRQIETNHSLWELASIQVVGATSLPMIGAAVFAGQAYGFGAALLGLFIANCLLLGFAFAILRMSERGHRANTLENAAHFVGKWGAYLLALMLLADAFSQFVMQLSVSSSYLVNLFGLSHEDSLSQLIRWGTILGIISTAVCMPGITLLKRVAVLALPLLLTAYLILVFRNPTITHQPFRLWNMFLAIPLMLGAGAAVIVDYPTFLRHTRSYKDAVSAITIIQGLTFLLGVTGLFIGSRFVNGIQVDGSVLEAICLFVVVVGSCVVMNATNVYSASIGWEVLAPFLSSPKEYLILGLVLTLAFAWFGGLIPVGAINYVSDYSLAVLCAVLVLAFLVKLRKPGVPDTREMIGYAVAWVVGMVLVYLGNWDVIDGGEGWGVMAAALITVGTAFSAGARR